MQYEKEANKGDDGAHEDGIRVRRRKRQVRNNCEQDEVVSVRSRDQSSI